MAKYSSKERLIASILSSSPRVKGWIKKVYVILNYCIYRKNYRYKIFNANLEKILNLIQPLNDCDETFFGYYDKSPENTRGWIIFNETRYTTSKKPSSNNPIWINILNRDTNECIVVGDSFSYNWQQGSRAQWIDENRLIHNYYDRIYKSAIFNIQTQVVTKTFDYPVQDTYKDEYFLSINYSRIMRLRPDYGYRNLPPLSDNEMNRFENDGIWKVDISSGNSSLAVGLKDVVSLSKRNGFDNALHKVNHVMISPDGKRFIFIHRWYVGKQRFDRLIISDFSKMKVLADEKMVSHMCWVDDNTLFGYLRNNGKDAFYFIDINNGNYKECSVLTSLGNGDGHPSCHGKWVTIDTYPDKSLMQHLYLYNILTDDVYNLLEVKHGLNYKGESRCDLHPRFSPDGNRIYFDTVYEGCRKLAYIDVSSIVNKHI